MRTRRDIRRAVAWLSLGLLSISCAPQRPDVEVRFRPIGPTVRLQAADAGRIDLPMQRVTDGGRTYLTTPIGPARGQPTPQDADEGGKAVFEFTTPAEDTYTLLAEVYWHNGGSNSFWVRVDGEPWQRLGNAGAEGEWIHIQGPSWKLAAGPHTVTIREREWGARLATVYLSPMPEYISRATRFEGGRFLADADGVLVYPGYALRQDSEPLRFAVFPAAAGEAGVLAGDEPRPMSVAGPDGRVLYEGTLPARCEAEVAIARPAGEAYRIRVGEQEASWQWLGPRLDRIEAFIAGNWQRPSPFVLVDITNSLAIYRENILRGYRYDSPGQRFVHAAEYVNEQFGLAEELIHWLPDHGPSGTPTGLQPHSAVLDKAKDTMVRYWLFLPKGYDADSKKLWPTILYLHGAGGRGTNIELVRLTLHDYAVAHEDFPFIVISPQCPAESWWSAPEGIELLKEFMAAVLPTYRIDPDRLYLSGSSMGGYGTWRLAAEIPERFAAIAPVCGGGEPADAAKLKNVPAWVFHGDADTTVPPAESQKMVDALRAAGGDVRFTLYPGVDHDSWTPAYSDPELYTWLLAHARRSAPAP